ncbi:hypothetical protein [Methylocapsa acidiphila]|uniref:hypothetical protein n=1 Tax=Methylocapsa acidiphila TaxID=133552 RepID=UPI00042621B2|nr:hypothetical protein [Methylocapsa acidiphila]
MSGVDAKRGRPPAQGTADSVAESPIRKGGANLPAATAFGGVAILAAAVVGAALVIKPPGASALPSFARQTGQPCSTCHTAFPQLTPFGRRFKLGGYTMGGGLTWEQGVPPIAAMVIPTFTHTDVNQDKPPVPWLHTNNNVLLQQGSMFYAGQIYGNLGAFIQGTYDGASQHIFLDASDIRYADTTKLFDLDVTYGISVNNAPSVQDVWNTTPAWGFPFVASTLAPQFSLPGTLIEGGLSNIVIGTGAYTFWNDMLYLDVSAYQNLSAQALKRLGVPPDVIGSISIDGVAPYWRAAFEYNVGEHSFEVGTFGLHANTLPARVAGFGFDEITDVAFDAQYQFIGDPHNITIRAVNIHETQKLNSTFLQGGSSNLNNSLDSFKTSIEYVYDHTYSLSAGYFSVYGSADAMLYGANSLVNLPNGKGIIFDAAFLPFSKGGPSVYPWLNAKIGVSYTSYLKIFGGVTNFDGASHNASGNNTVLLYSWIAF